MRKAFATSGFTAIKGELHELGIRNLVQTKSLNVPTRLPCEMCFLSYELQTWRRCKNFEVVFDIFKEWSRSHLALDVNL